MAEEGQAVEQPSAEATPLELAQAAALSIIEREEGVKAPEEKADPPAEEAEPEEAETTPEAKKEEPPQPTDRYHFTVKAEDGSDVEVEEDLDGLKRGYMLHKDYSRKTAQLARQREAVESETKAAIAKARSEYDAKLADAEKVITETLTPELQDVDLNKLAVENPAEYVKHFQRLQAISSKLNKIKVERASIAEQQRAEVQATLRKQATEAIEVLQTKIPQWSNDLYGKILKGAIDNYGFKSDEVGGITDPRAIEVLHDAMQFRALKAKPITEKKVVAKPKAVLKPGGGEQPDPKAQQIKGSWDQLTKSGNPRDAIALAAQLIGKQGAGY